MSKYLDYNGLQHYTDELWSKAGSTFAKKDEYGSPLVASTVAGMTDHDKVYVYTGSETGYNSGHWYYWNGSAWTDGGIYNSTAMDYDDICQIIKISSPGTTLGDVATTLNQVNTAGKHVFFDLSALGVMMYLCTIFIDTDNNIYRVFDLVSGRYAEGSYTATTLLTMATAQANWLAVQSQIDHLQKEIDELGGKSVISNYDALGDLILSGNSEDVISPGDQIDINWIKTVLGTTTNGLTVTCSDMDAFITEVGEAEEKTYLFVYDGSHWTFNGENITLADYGLAVSGGSPATGEVMTIVTTVDTVPFTFTSYDTVEPVDNTVSHNWLLEQTYAPDTRAYDTYESALCLAINKSLAAGKYYIPMYSWRSGKTFNLCFTLAASVGSSTSKVQFKSNGYASGAINDKDGTSVASVYYPSGLTPVLYGTTTTAGSAVTPSFLSDAEITADGTYTKLEAGADITLGDFDECAFGNNGWGLSNIRKYLNDDSQTGSWTPTHDNDIPSAYNLNKGWLYGIDPRVLAIMKTAKVKWTCGRGKDGIVCDGETLAYNSTFTSEDKVFLLSMMEMGFATINTSEGAITDYYKEICGGSATDSAVAGRAKYNKAGGTLNSYRWSRSASVGVSINARNVTSTGANDNNNARSALYVAPAFIIGKSAS